MSSLSKYSSLYIEFLKQNLKIMLEYKNDFVIGVFSTLLTQVCGIFFVWVLFENVKQINGWSFYEITFVYGLLTLAKGLDMIFFDNLHALGWEYIREGKFDIFMTRPISPLFQLIASHIQQDGFGLFLIGLVITIKSALALKLAFGILDMFLLILFVISGGVILASINLITATAGFWTVNSHIVMESVATLQEFALYPILIYPKFIGFILTWIIPYAFASFYPASYFLHKGLLSYSLLSPLIAVILWFIANKVWNFGIKNYTSTGS
ncbi:MAG: ABC-2 family transporter protein [bacterium]